MNINTFYKDTMVRLAMVEPELNKRTGIKCRALPGVTYKTDLEKDGFPLLSLRKIPLSFVPEILWFISGSDNIRPFLTKHTGIWDHFAELDGTVTSAYGKRWKNHDQLNRAIKKLKEDSSSRHAVIVTWDPAVDGVIKQKNVPCPYTFNLMIINGRLHMHNIVRSNDLILGFPTDVAGFALLQMMIAQELGISPGVYTHSISNCHFYQNQEDVVDELCRREVKKNIVTLSLPKNSFKRACELDESLIPELKNAFFGYDPHPMIKNIPIAI